MATTKRITFPGHDSLSLAGRLELPDSRAECFAVFCHCFTCSKDMLVAYRISKQLAQLGIATLRFDFAGLGESEGEFAETSFSTTITDLLAAVDYLEREFESPTLLIGHSLGGTTALACAQQIDSVKHIVTIASPSQPAHVLHHFGPALAELEAGRDASIIVAGKHYAISPQFLSDIKQHDMQAQLSELEKPVLIFNVQNDSIVEQHNAEQIQQWTQGDTTLINLENSDHVISDKASASYIAQQIRMLIK